MHLFQKWYAENLCNDSITTGTTVKEGVKVHRAIAVLFCFSETFNFNIHV